VFEASGPNFVSGLVGSPGCQHAIPSMSFATNSS
jgi:hypothetical protein